ncbi:hypothetical protein AN641_01055 [Candidatus Epulonipiscioides gigas]|nr:hypothetical protein AN641_01055 [Epulopiscium sp. SCG-C07WGA-EpuloA2]
MKWKWLTITVALFISKNVYANETITYIDRNLHQAILEHVDTNLNKQIEKSELQNLTTLNLYDKQLTNTAPITSLLQLKNLELSKNNLTDLTMVSSLINLTNLSVAQNQLVEINQISYLENLVELHLYENQITDINPIIPLNNLKQLYLDYNEITDLTPLTNMTNLTVLSLNANNIVDITPLTHLEKLTDLNLAGNQITDIRALSNLNNLTYINLTNNPINLQDNETIKILNDLQNNGTRIIFDKPIPSITPPITIPPKIPVVDYILPEHNEQEAVSYLVKQAPTVLPDIPYDELDNIEDIEDLIEILEDLTEDLTLEQLLDEYVKELITQYAEAAISHIASKRTSKYSLTISYDTIRSLEAEANEIADELVTVFASAGLPLTRPLERNVMVIMRADKKADIILDASLMQANIDNLRIVTDEAEFVFNKSDFKPEPIKITFRRTDKNLDKDDDEGIDYTNTSYNISVIPSMPLTMGLLKADEKNPSYQAIFNGDMIISSHYNPVNDKIEAKISQDGNYIVAQNEQKFIDIYNVGEQIKDAIMVITAQGIMSGKTVNEFAPDEIVSRNEFANMLIQMGYNNSLFLGEDTLQRMEMISTIAQILQTEKNHDLPLYPDNYLVDYLDADIIPGWAGVDIALATREDIVPARKDGNFAPTSTVTRGEVAFVLKELFDRIN